MKENNKKEIARKGEKAIIEAESFIKQKKREIDEVMGERRRGFVEKSQSALAGIEKAVADLSRKIEVYKKEPILDEKRRRQALMALGTAAALTAAIIGAKKIKNRRAGNEE